MPGNVSELWHTSSTLSNSQKCTWHGFGLYLPAIVFQTTPRHHSGSSMGQANLPICSMVVTILVCRLTAQKKLKGPDHTSRPRVQEQANYCLIYCHRCASSSTVCPI